MSKITVTPEVLFHKAEELKSTVLVIQTNYKEITAYISEVESCFSFSGLEHIKKQFEKLDKAGTVTTTQLLQEIVVLSDMAVNYDVTERGNIIGK